ncbi:galactosyl transferase GMA12/MNN10 family-domain-containing protein [Aspergillus venezuelensis]
MQFAVPPRKGHVSPPYAHSSFLTFQRRKQLKLVAILSVALLALYLLWPQYPSNSTGLATSSIGTGGVVIVTVLDRASYSDTYLQKIIKNRKDYAERHGYTNFFANLSDYEPYIGSSPKTWGIVPAVRHAMASHPTATYFFHLDAHALFMNPSESLESRLLNEHRLEALMRRDVPVVPPDSIIKTFAQLRAEDIDLVLTNDAEDLNTGSFVLRQGDFARFLLDTWFDPLYRSYNFAKAELHSLEHIVQWHPTVLALLALVPQRVINSYSKDSPGAGVDGTYKDGDLVVRFFGCDTDPTRNCEWEMEPYYKFWAKRVKLE